jgi:WD40 repeat protein
LHSDLPSVGALTECRFDAHGPYSTLHGHTDWAEVLAHHPAHNGQIVSAGADATIRRWEPPSELYPEQYICQEVVVGHKGAILCAVFTHDGQQLITGSQDTTIKCWAWEQDPDKLESKDTSDRLIRTFTDHTDRVTALAVAEHALISVSWDLTIRFWDLSTWTLAHQINKAHSDFITDISYCAERAEFATSSMDWLVYVWSAPKRSIVAVLRGHTAEVTRVRWNAVLNGWVSVSDDQTVIHWSVDGEVLHRVSLPEESPTALAIDSVLGYAVVGLSDASVVVIDMLAQSELRTIVQRHTGHSDIVKDIIHVHEKNQFVTASWDHTIRVFVAHPRERIKDLALSSAAANVSVPSAKQALRRDSEDTVPYAELNPPFVPKTLKFPIPSLPFEAVQTRHEKKEPDSRVKTELAQKLDELEVTLTKLVTDQRRAQQESLQREKAETAKSGGSGFGKAGGDKKRAADLKPKQTARKSQQA